VPEELPEVLSSDDEGFADLSFRLVDLRKGDGVYHLVAKGQRRGRVVGFAATLTGDWDAQPLERTESNLYWGGVTMVSLGQESDEFLRALAEIYGIPERPAHMCATTEFAAVGLAADPREVVHRPVKLKLFFEPRDRRAHEQGYAEVYLNVDPTQAVVELHEKDPDYRRPLIAALASPSIRAARRPWWRAWLERLTGR
jgi:hypothetical protein